MQFVTLTTTRLDLQEHCEVTYRHTREFEVNWKHPVLTISNAQWSREAEHVSDIDQMTTNMNYICDELWRRDQSLAAGQRVTSGGQRVNLAGQRVNSVALPYM